jgi:cytochrome c-type biogenesis protein
MISSLFDFLSEALYQNFAFAVLASFLWGIASILLSPCHLASLPLVIGFINSQPGVTTRKSFQLSLVFSVGILITIAAIGLLTAALGRMLGDVGSIGTYVVAIVFFIVGLYFLDVIDLSRLGINVTGTKQKGLRAALVLGLIFGIGLGPCAFAFMAPVLGVVFEIAHTNLLNAVLLLSAFAVGHCLVIVLFGTAAGKVQQYLRWSEQSKALKYVKRVCGVLIILGGVYMIYNTMQ